MMVELWVLPCRYLAIELECICMSLDLVGSYENKMK